MDIDKKIVEGILEKDENSLEIFIEMYGGLIKSIVNYHLKSFECYREECMQDILIFVWNNIDRYDPKKTLLRTGLVL